MTVRRRETQGTSSVIHSFNKYSIVYSNCLLKLVLDFVMYMPFRAFDHSLAKIILVQNPNRKREVHFTFRNFENWNKSAHWRKTRTFFFGFNLHEFPLFTITGRRKKPRGTSSLIHFFNKPSIVKQLFIETGAWLCHIYVIPCIRSFRCLISHTLWPRMIFFEGYPSISPSFFLETWTVQETLLPSPTELANVMQKKHNRILRGSVII